MNERIYKASLDRLSKILSMLTCIFLISFSFYNIYLFLSNNHSHISLLGISVLLPLIIIVWPYLYRPLYYTLDSNGIGIKRPIGKVVYTFQEIKSVESADIQFLKGALRVGGSGGFFGYYGWFYKRGIGLFKLYATQRKNFVIIHLKNEKTVVITPDDLKMVEDMRSCI